MNVNGYEIKTDADLTGANLWDANLTRADLTGANLTDADLTRADLTGANLWDANLTRANLTRANLTGANLTDADLTGANLWDANLTDADLTGANLWDANLTDADLTGARLPNFQIVPEVGSFTCWKRVSDNVILELLVPPDAKRASCLTSRKCRVERARVIAATDLDGNAVTGEWQNCTHTDTPTTYRVGDLVCADSFDDDIRVECTHGIHVFITRREAVEWE